MRSLKRGMLVYVDFGQRHGHEQAGSRPAVVLSSDAYNQHNNTVVVAPITSQVSRRNDYHTKLPLPDGLYFKGNVLLQHLRSVDVQFVEHRKSFGQVPDEFVQKCFNELNHWVWN